MYHKYYFMLSKLQVTNMCLHYQNATEWQNYKELKKISLLDILYCVNVGNSLYFPCMNAQACIEGFYNFLTLRL